MMGKLATIGGLLSLFKGAGGGSNDSSRPAAVPLPPAAPTKEVTAAREEKETDKASDRLRVSEKNRKGRRAAILSNITEEDAKLASVKRPTAGSPRTASVLFGG